MKAKRNTKIEKKISKEFLKLNGGMILKATIFKIQNKLRVTK